MRTSTLLPLLALVLMVLVCVSADTFSKSAYKSQMIAAHNKYRREFFQSPMLAWNASLEAMAQEWANRCVFTHRSYTSRKGSGENLFASWGKAKKATMGKDASQCWYDEKKDYIYSSNQCRAMCGHYTQIVWKKTTTFGCGFKACPGKLDLVVCNYWPTGNKQGEKPY